jgi:hypothetical protein
MLPLPSQGSNTCALDASLATIVAARNLLGADLEGSVFFDQFVPDAATLIEQMDLGRGDGDQDATNIRRDELMASIRRTHNVPGTKEVSVPHVFSTIAPRDRGPVRELLCKTSEACASKRSGAFRTTAPVGTVAILTHTHSDYSPPREPRAADATSVVAGVVRLNRDDRDSDDPGHFTASVFLPRGGGILVGTYNGVFGPTVLTRALGDLGLGGVDFVTTRGAHPTEIIVRTSDARAAEVALATARSRTSGGDDDDDEDEDDDDDDDEVWLLPPPPRGAVGTVLTTTRPKRPKRRARSSPDAPPSARSGRKSRTTDGAASAAAVVPDDTFAIEADGEVAAVGDADDETFFVVPSGELSPLPATGMPEEMEGMCELQFVDEHGKCRAVQVSVAGGDGGGGGGGGSVWLSLEPCAPVVAHIVAAPEAERLARDSRLEDAIALGKWLVSFMRVLGAGKTTVRAVAAATHAAPVKREGVVVSALFFELTTQGILSGEPPGVFRCSLPVSVSQSHLQRLAEENPKTLRRVLESVVSTDGAVGADPDVPLPLGAPPGPEDDVLLRARRVRRLALWWREYAVWLLANSPDPVGSELFAATRLAPPADFLDSIVDVQQDAGEEIEQRILPLTDDLEPVFVSERNARALSPGGSAPGAPLFRLLVTPKVAEALRMWVWMRMGQDAGVFEKYRGLGGIPGALVSPGDFSASANPAAHVHLVDELREAASSPGDEFSPFQPAVARDLTPELEAYFFAPLQPIDLLTTDAAEVPLYIVQYAGDRETAEKTVFVWNRLGINAMSVVRGEGASGDVALEDLVRQAETSSGRVFGPRTLSALQNRTFVATGANVMRNEAELERAKADRALIAELDDGLFWALLSVRG